MTEPTSNVALGAQGLCKSYGRVRALRGVNLQVRRGEIFGFLGPNGAGKTTTIRCLLDMIRPDAGLLRVLGLDPQAQPVAVQARTGYLPGETQFYDKWTADRQLRFFNDMRGGRADWGHVLRLAERLQLDLRTPIKNLSKGNKQKIGVIQALMHRPELLLLDEPTAGLDPLMQQEVLALLREANAAGTTVFFSSHIMSEVESVAARVAIIRVGEIVEVAETSELTHRAVRSLTVRFKRPVDATALQGLPGVEVLSQAGVHSAVPTLSVGASPDQLVLRVTGDMEQLMVVLGGLPVLDLETARPTLEEAFLAYYKQ